MALIKCFDKELRYNVLIKDSELNNMLVYLKSPRRKREQILR